MPSKRGLARARRANDERVADVADGEVQAKGGVARRAAIEVRSADARRPARGARFFCVAGPDAAERHEVREVQGADDRAADVGVDVPRQAPEPGVGRVEGLVLDGEAARLDDFLDPLALLRAAFEVLVPDRDGRRQVAEGDEVVAELLERRVGVGGLVGRGVVDERRLLLRGLLLDERPEALALAATTACGTSR